ncbi:chitin deacetylase 7 [Lepeophtheirus salmonis]|uniref:chitin deacetylase 7 n=1 Tax=Lepeophtheirus salmonis TaxID=72036 RepID=UPI001AE5CFB0|nr:chitin deacetylase 7-like [Lepeophtheirus salmonis]
MLPITGIFFFCLLHGISSSFLLDRPSNCDVSKCKLPLCSCSGTQPDIPLKERPQIVYLTFDDAFTGAAKNSYFSKIFEGPSALKNPNGRPIRATHFLTHKYNSYTDAHEYYSLLGHEMASHSISHYDNTSYWVSLNESEWRDEMIGMKEMMHLYGNMNMADIKGTRAPFLQIGGDVQFRALSEDFEYDCSMPSRAFGYTNLANGLWPYTLDYRSIQDCQLEPCPLESYPKEWIQPMLDLEDLRVGIDGSIHGQPCAMLDSCVVPNNLGKNPKLVEDMLMHNFNRSYYGNTRAPFGIYMHAAWFFGQDWHWEGYHNFLKKITKYTDVWILPVSAGIEYMKNPIPNSKMGDVEPFKGDPKTFPKFNCEAKQSCRYTNVQGIGLEMREIYMSICGTTCPENYPWLRNVHGKWRNP